MINIFTYLSFTNISIGQLYQSFVILLLSIILLITTLISLTKLPSSHNMKLRFNVIFLSSLITIINTAVFFVFLYEAKYNYNIPIYILPIFSITNHALTIFSQTILALILLIPKFYTRKQLVKTIWLITCLFFLTFILLIFGITNPTIGKFIYLTFVHQNFALIIFNSYFILFALPHLIFCKFRSNLLTFISILILFIGNTFHTATLLIPTLLDYLFIYNLAIILSFIFFEIYVFIEIIQALLFSNNEVQKLNEELEHKIDERTQKLFNTNKELFQSNYMLHQEKEKLNAIIENLDEGIIVSNVSNKVLLINESAKSILKIKEQSIGKILSELIDDEPFTKEINNLILKKIKKISREIKIDNKTSGIKHVLVTSTLTNDSKGNIIGIITLLRDISKEIELEQLKTGFLRTISHELKTPLTTIIGFAETIRSERRGKLNEEQKEFIEIINKESQHLHNLINNLLEFTKISSNKISIFQEEVNLKSLISEIINSFRPKAEVKSIKILFDDKYPIPSIQADREKLIKVFENIIGNAIEYTLSGQIEISFETYPNKIITAIKDTGIGISENNLNRIFETFVHLEPKETKEYTSGLGIGLSIAKDFILLHDGKIWAESKIDQGSTFFIELPISR